MKSSVFVVLSLFAVIELTLNPVSAAELSWRPRLEAGTLYYKFKDENAATVRRDVVVAQEGIDVETWMPIIGGGLTAFIDRFFIDGYAQYAFNGSDRFDQALSQTQVSATNQVNVTTDFTSNNADIERIDYALSVGYSVADETALYVGVKGARTDLDVNSAGQQFSNGNFVGNLTQKLDLKFSYIGPFLGATQAWNVDKGTFTANVGLAFLWSTFEQTSGGQKQPDIDGNTIGLNFGVSWIGLTPVNDLTYSLGIKGYNYSFKADEAGIGDTKETAVTLAAGLAYAF